jgi:hypothetical protein
VEGNTLSDNDELRQAELEDYASRMSPEDFAAFTARVRTPSSAEQLKAVAGKIISGTQLDAWVENVDPSKFVNNDGQIDENRVATMLTALFGAGERPNYGQRSGSAPGDPPGESGRREARKRFGSETESRPTSESRVARGAAGRAEAQRRFGKKGQA